MSDCGSGGDDDDDEENRRDGGGDDDDRSSDDDNDDRKNDDADDDNGDDGDDDDDTSSEYERLTIRDFPSCVRENRKGKDDGARVLVKYIDDCYDECTDEDGIIVKSSEKDELCWCLKEVPRRYWSYYSDKPWWDEDGPTYDISRYAGARVMTA